MEATRLRAWRREKWAIPSAEPLTPKSLACGKIRTVLCGAAVSGRIAVEGQDTRNFALDFDSFKREAIAAVKAGAAMVHIDTGGIAAIMESGLSVPEIFDKVAGDINAEVGQDWVADGNILRGRSFAENLYPVTSGMLETTLMAPRFPVDWMQTTAKVCMDNEVPLFLVIHSAAEVDLALSPYHLARPGRKKLPTAFDVLTRLSV